MKSKSRRGWIASPRIFIFIAAGLTAAAVALLSLRYGWPWPISYLVGMNCATFLGYGYDKMASRRKLSRIPENTLHLLAFSGGTPAAFLAQGVFRHKTVKRSFR